MDLNVEEYQILESIASDKPPPPQLELKVVLLGDSNVGKTALVHWYVDKAIHSEGVTIGTSVHFKQVTCEGRDAMLAIWDTAGQEKYASLGRIHSRNADAVLVCYDITNRESFRNIERWLSMDSLPDDVLVVLVGCKSDQSCVREISTQEGEVKARDLRQGGVQFYETSVFTSSNVDEVFDFVLSRLVLVKELQGRYNKDS